MWTANRSLSYERSGLKLQLATEYAGKVLSVWVGDGPPTPSRTRG